MNRCKAHKPRVHFDPLPDPVSDTNDSVSASEMEDTVQDTREGAPDGELASAESDAAEVPAPPCRYNLRKRRTVNKER